MEPIKDLGELQPTLDSLAAKGLIMYLTPPGRGCVVTHALYLDRELDKVRREAGALHAEAAASDPAPITPQRAGASPPPPTIAASIPTQSSQLRSEHPPADVSALRQELATLKQELADLRTEFDTTAAELRRDLDDLNRQLGN
jgi:hypothetical protein